MPAALPNTVWLAHNDSAPPILVYWFCTMSRGARVSILVPGAGVATLPGALAQVVGAIVIDGPEKVEAEVLFQSTWNL